MSRIQPVNDDCMSWLTGADHNSIHAVCTDPPYGLVEFSKDNINKLRSGRGGVWRIPPKINGHERSPLPRFTTLTREEREGIREFFTDFSRLLFPILVPGAHCLVASNSCLQFLVQDAFFKNNFEVRGVITRNYFGFRGGDRPKNFEQEFKDISVTPRSSYEPWLLFRKPISEPTIGDNLRKWGTGGLRRPSIDAPVFESIESERTPNIEKSIADHPSLKPQSFMRQVCRMLLPLGKGMLLDPFMGSGSTLAACKNLGYDCTGIEIDPHYYQIALRAIPELSNISCGKKSIHEEQLSIFETV